MDLEKLRSLVQNRASLPIDDANELKTLASSVETIARSEASKRVPKQRTMPRPVTPTPTRKSTQGNTTSRRTLIPLKTPPFFLQLESKTDPWFLRSDAYIALCGEKSCQMIDAISSVSIEQKVLHVNDYKLNIKSDKDTITDLIFGKSPPQSNVRAFFICAKACDGIPPCNNLTYGFYVNTIMNAEFLCTCAFVSAVPDSVDWRRSLLVMPPYINDVLDFAFVHLSYVGHDGFLKRGSFVGLLAEEIFTRDQRWFKFRQFVEQSEDPLATFLDRFHRGVLSPVTRLLLCKCMEHEEEDPLGMIVHFIWEIGLDSSSSDTHRQLQAIAIDGTRENKQFRVLLQKHCVVPEEPPEPVMDVHTRVFWMNSITHSLPTQLNAFCEAANAYELCLKDKNKCD